MKSEKNIFLPVILGADENAYACARLFFEKYGIISSVLCSSPLAATAHSKILRRAVISDLDRPDIFQSKIPQMLSDLKERHGSLLLIPCSDYYAELCVNFAAEIQEFIENPFVSKETYSLFFDKEAFARLSNSLNFPHPETVALSTPDFSEKALPFDFPVVIKPFNSNSSEYLHADIKNKHKVYFCHNEKEFKEILQNFRESSFKQKLVVQRFIPGDTESMFTVNAYCDKSARVRLIGAAQAVIDCRDSLSTGNYLVLRTVKDRKLCNLCAEILEKLNYVGFANFDIKRDSKTGKYYFLELNPRQGRSSYCIHTAGESLMQEMAEDIIFKKPFYGRKYAERDGIWSNLPMCFVKKSLPYELKSVKSLDYALGFKHDYSPLRALKLARRNYTVAKRNLLKK